MCEDVKAGWWTYLWFCVLDPKDMHRDAIVCEGQVWASQRRVKLLSSAQQPPGPKMLWASDCFRKSRKGPLQTL